MAILFHLNLFFFHNRLRIRPFRDRVTDKSSLFFTDQEKIKREPQLFLPVRPDTLFAPYDIHKQGLQTNRCSVSIVDPFCLFI